LDVHIPSNFFSPPTTTIDGYILKVGNSCELKLCLFKSDCFSYFKTCNKKMNTVKGTLRRFATIVAGENFREGIREL